MNSVPTTRSRSKTNDNKEYKMCNNNMDVGDTINSGELMKNTKYQDDIETSIISYQKVADKPSSKSKNSIKNKDNNHSEINRNIGNKSYEESVHLQEKQFGNLLKAYTYSDTSNDYSVYDLHDYCSFLNTTSNKSENTLVEDQAIEDVIEDFINRIPIFIGI